MEIGAGELNFERGLPKDHPSKFGLTWFNNFRGEDLNVIFYQNMLLICISINRLKEKFHRNNNNNISFI